MSSIGSPVHSLFPPKSASSGSGDGQRARVMRAVQQFEGLLWDEVAQAMSAVRLGPSDLGYAGQMYQRMLWHKIAAQDFAPTDQALTRAAMEQLMPHSAAQSPQSSLSTATVAAAPKAAPASQASARHDAASWVRAVWHAIRSGAEALGVPAKALLAQAALETGWGQHVSANNIFGVKAHGEGPNFTALTHEFADGVLRQVHAAFQGYSSVNRAVDDFVRILQQFHPHTLGQSTIAGYARALQQTGYATDPRYANKIEAVATSPRMQQLLASVKP